MKAIYHMGAKEKVGDNQTVLVSIGDFKRMVLSTGAKKVFIENRMEYVTPDNKIIRVKE